MCIRDREKEGTPIPRFELIRPTRREYMREQELFESAWSPIDRQLFSEKWLEEAQEAANKVDTETIRLATGLLLPIWSALPNDHLVVNRIADKEGNSWLGRLVFDDHVVQLFTKLGLDRTDNLPPTDLVKSALTGRSVDLARPFPMCIKRSLVNGSPRIELVGAAPAQLAWLKSDRMLHRGDPVPDQGLRAGTDGSRDRRADRLGLALTGLPAMRTVRSARAHGVLLSDLRHA